MAELVKPKRKKIKPKAPQLHENKAQKNDVEKEIIVGEINKAPSQVLSEVTELSESFEIAQEINETNVLVDACVQESADVSNLVEQFSAMTPTAPLANFDVGFFEDGREKNETKETVVVSGARMIDLVNVDIEQEIQGNYERQEIEAFTEKELEKFYFNDEIVAVVDFLKDFSSKPNPENDELYKLLDEYVKLREIGRIYDESLGDLEKNLNECANNLWTYWPNVEFSQRGKCRHGRDVVFTHKYGQARRNPEEFAKLQECIAQRKEVMKKKWMNDVDGVLHQSAIRVNIWFLQKKILHLIADDAMLMNISRDAGTKKNIDQLCQSLGTLFYFLRKVPRNVDEGFVNVVQDYLTTILSLLIRIGGWREHLIILANILCCPPGIALWAVDFVQCPIWNTDHACALLLVLLQPIEKRDAFLKHRLEECAWRVVDDDGLELDADDGVVSESVLFNLLDQVPFQKIFEKYLAVDASSCNEYSFMKMLAFFSKILEMFHGGLVHYCDENYRQLSKKLGKMIRNILQLVTDELELFLDRNDFSNRIQVEYDAFFIRSSKILLSQPKVWQFLATAPFDRISNGTRWKLFWEIVHQENNNNDSKREFCHLMTALCQLALPSKDESRKFIRLVAFHLFNVGFIYPETWDWSYKDAKSTLAALAADNPHLFSELLEVNNYFLEKELIINQNALCELWQALPVEEWKPVEQDLTVLGRWLLAPVLGTLNEIAREILLRLNYSEISYDIQKKAAWALLRASHKNPIDAAFAKICLNILCKLRLHMVDRRDITLVDVPDVANDSELGVSLIENSCTAAFIALQTTSVGHFVPVIFSDGFKLIRLLYDKGYYDAAFLSLDNLVTMFWGCPDSLTSCQDFSTLLGDIVNSERMYVKVVKFFSGGETTGPILRKFYSMIVNHLERSGVEFLPQTVSLWIRAITALPLWQSSFAAVFILDLVCRQAFTNPAAWLKVVTIFEELLPKLDSSSPTSPIGSWFGFRKPAPMPSLLQNGFGKYVSWFAYAVISVEFEVFENSNGLWNQILQEMWDKRGQKLQVDDILKKVCGNLKLPGRSANEIAFYRWMNQALEMPETHPLNILVWQKFLELYLSRYSGSLVSRGCSGDFFLNDTLKQKLVNRLKILETAQPNLKNVFQTITIWLKDKTVKDANLIVEMLPAQYNPSLLADVLNKQTFMWIAMLPLSQIKGEVAKTVNVWAKNLGRKGKNVRDSITREPESASFRIQKRLSELTLPKPMPSVKLIDLSISVQCLNEPFLKDAATSWFLTFEDFLGHCRVQMNQVSNNEASVLRNPGKMYQCEKKKIMMTKGCDSDGFCGKPGQLQLSLEIWSKNENVCNQFNYALRNFLTECLTMTVPSAALASFDSLYVLMKLLMDENSKAFSEIAAVVFTKLCTLWSLSDQLSPPIAEFTKKFLLILCEGYIKNESKYVPLLLNKIFNVPNSTFLVQFFNPNQSNPGQFLQMYEKVLKIFEMAHLISHFDLNQWLENAEDGNILKIIHNLFDFFTKHSEIGNSLLKILNEHLQILILHRFPKYFPIILEKMFENVENVAPETWYALLNAFAPNDLRLENFDLKDVFDFSSAFASKQSVLAISDLQLAIFMFDKVSWELRKTDKKTLYEHFGRNSDAVSCFLLTIVKAAIIFFKDCGKQVLQMVKIDEIFGPWLTPLCISTETIQQPFTADFAASAGYATASFTDLIRFLIQNLPENADVLIFALQFYVRHFCHDYIDGLVLSVIHSSFVSLPWYNMQPGFEDVHAIFQVMSQSLPLNHIFLGNIFASVIWKDVMHKSVTEADPICNTKLHVYMLHLLIKFRSYAPFKNNKAFHQLVELSLGFQWHLLDAGSYQSAATLFLVAMNPDVVLENLVPDLYDAPILRLLQTAAGYRADIKAFHFTTPEKRVIFVSTMIKCLATAFYNHSQTISSRVVCKMISRLLTDIETIVAATVPDLLKSTEASQLLSVILKCLSETKLSVYVENAIVEWLKVTDAKLVITALFFCGGTQIENPIFYGAIMEASVESYFANTGLRDWFWLFDSLVMYANGPGEHLLLSNSYYLILCVHLLKLIRLKLWTRNQMTMILQMFSSLKPNGENEPKLVLLIALALKMISTEKDAPSLLQMYADNLTGFANDRGSGFLSAIVGRLISNSFSVKFKLCCVITVTGIRNVLLSKYSHISEDKYAKFWDKAENNKAYSSVMPCLLNAKKDLPDATEMPQVCSLLLKTADQLFDKNYFLTFDYALGYLPT